MSSVKLGPVLAKAFLELVGMLLLLLPLAYIYLFTSTYDPFHRGFFCDDQDLKHPYKDQTVPIITALLIWLGLAVFFILLVETLRSVVLQGQRRSTPIPNSKYPPWLAVELYRYYGFFALGACGCLLFTEVAKYTVGRLRPHYLTLCKPDYGADGLCKDEWDYNRFVVEEEREVCTGLHNGETTPSQLHEARLSFLSGHSSFSFYCATYLVVYLQARLSNFPLSADNQTLTTIYRMLKVFRPFLQFGMISLAFWISLTRISDYYHHPYDVVTGALVGIVFASSTLLVMADVFNKRSAFWKSLDPGPTAPNDQTSETTREMNIPYIDEPESNSQVTTKSRVVL